MKHHRISFLALTCALSALLFTSCQQRSQLNDLQDAQDCLNTAPASQALSCVSKLSSDNSDRANALKCASYFISEGFSSPSSFIDALNSLNNSSGCGGGCSSTVTAMTSFNFTAAGVSTPTQTQTNVDAANSAFSVCSQSGVKIYTQISSLFKIGTLTAKLAYDANGSATPTEQQIKDQITNVDSATLGDIVSTTYNSTCQDTTNASDSTKQYCSQLQSALSSYTTSTQIGNCLKFKLTNGAAGSCP